MVEAGSPVPKISKYCTFYISFNAICVALCSTIAALSLSAGLISMPTFLYLFEHKQLMDDWASKPIIDLQLVDVADGCEIGYEALFGRIWNGTKEVCETFDYNRVKSIQAIDEKDDCTGTVIDPLPPINMTAD